MQGNITHFMYILLAFTFLTAKPHDTWKILLRRFHSTGQELHFTETAIPGARFTERCHWI